MAAKACARSQDFPRRFCSVLCYACSECCLIILLWVATLVSYVATRFACICKLQAPCVLCSRLDHGFHGKAWFAVDLVCGAHRSEISCLSYCKSHNKLAQSDELCKICLLSCTTLASNPDKHDIVGANENVNSRSRSRCTRLCSCCSVPFKKTFNAQKLPEIANGRVSDDEMSEIKRKHIIDAQSVEQSADDSFDHLPQGVYRDQKFSCGFESEIRTSDNDSSMKPANTTSVVPLNAITGADCQTNGIRPGKVLGSFDPTIGPSLDEINRSLAIASDNNATLWKVVPEQVLAELPKEKTVVELGTGKEATRDIAASGNAGAAKPGITGTSLSARILVNHNNSMKNAFGSRGNLQSPRPSEIISARDSNSKTQEEVKSFLSQMSSVRGLDVSSNEAAPSPRNNLQIDECNATSRRPLFEGASSIMEPYDVNLITEESSVKHLKRQIEFDRKSMNILYKELEEERSASAVAASEAMTMINRLQEEKASMQMEALQYLRMMEEQAEYDQEAIEKLNDLLTDREKELLDLDAELKNYRSVLRYEPFDDGKLDATDTMINIRHGRNAAFEVLNGLYFGRNSMSGFEGEKAYILQSLSRLEEKLHIFTNGLASDDANNEEDRLLREHTMGDGQYIENSQLDGGSSPLPWEHSNGESTSVQQTNANKSVEDNHKDNRSCSPFDDDKMSAVTSVKNEMSLLNTRLKALEADQKSLRLILSSLNCSGDGVRCVQGITSHLRELRRVVTEQRETAVL